MKISQILLLMGGLSVMAPAVANDDDGGDYEAAPVSYTVQEQEDTLDQYDDGDYAAAPVSWDAKKAAVKPSAQVKLPQKKAVKPVSKNTKQASQQRWAKLASSEEAFE